ncbi:MAG: APC family permease [Tissierellales bacterium]|jgi:amino acid transporter|nr:APC family permease [Tissierellales bacterium]
MKGRSEESFEKVLSKKDIFALAFGAMIGWGWVVLTGEWIQKAGAFGAIISFIIGGIMILFVGLTYAELTAALPENGGVSVFTERAFGWKASFLSSWAIILGYVSVVAFEVVAFPTVLEYFIGSGYLKGYLYTIQGYDVYGTWVLVGVGSSIIVTLLNYFGTKNVAIIQTGCTVLIAAVGLALFGGSVVNGNAQVIEPLASTGLKGILGVAVMTPFMFMGFDVIPQAAEEMNVPYKKIGKIMILAVIMAVLWYIMIIFSVVRSLNHGEIVGSGLVTATAMAKVFGGSNLASKILVLAGLSGIITSWNAFFIGGSRAIQAMAEKGRLPEFLARVHPKHKTPGNAILLIGGITTIAPLFGRNMLTWLVNAGSFTVILAYLMVGLAFVKLRIKEPNLKRPYEVKNWRFVGTMAIFLSSALFILFLPGFPSAMQWPYEWGIVIGWFGLGGVFFLKILVREKRAKRELIRAKIR